MDFYNLDKIKQKCKEINRNFEDVAAAAGISSRELEQIDGGIVKPEGETVILLTRSLDCNANDLFIDGEQLTININLLIELIEESGYIDINPLIDLVPDANFKKRNIINFINYFINKISLNDDAMNYSRMINSGNLREEEIFDFYKRFMIMKIMDQNYRVTNRANDITTLPISLIVGERIIPIWIDIHRGDLTMDEKTTVVMSPIYEKLDDETHNGSTYNNLDAEMYTRAVHEELRRLGLIEEVIDEIRYIIKKVGYSVSYKEYRVAGENFNINEVTDIHHILKKPYL